MPHLAGPPNRSDLLLYETYQIFIAIYTLYYMGTTERTHTAWKRVRGGRGKRKETCGPSRDSNAGLIETRFAHPNDESYPWTTRAIFLKYVINNLLITGRNFTISKH